MSRIRTTIRGLVRRPVMGLWYRLPVRLRIRTKLWRNPPHFPSMVFIEPTTRCNLRCVYCGNTHLTDRDKMRDLDFDIFRRLVDELKSLGVARLTLQGMGEPLLHKRIFDMIEYANAAGFFTRFNSNLALLSDETAERLVRSRHGEIAVSIDTPDPGVFADIRRGSTLDAVLGNIERLDRAKRRLRSKTPEIHVNCVLMKATIDQLPDLIARVRRLDVTAIDIEGLHVPGIPPEARLSDGSRVIDQSLADLPPDELDSIRRQIECFEEGDFHVLFFGDVRGAVDAPEPASGIRTCVHLWETPYVDSAGRVTPCCLLPDARFMNLGDLHEQSFEDIWFGERYERLRRQHLTNRHPECCRNCRALDRLVTPSGASQIRDGKSLFYGNIFLAKRSVEDGV